MKRILGLDIGVSSVGMALVIENENQTQIEKLAVRIVPEDPDFHGKFYSGNTASKNLGRTIKRGVRRNIQRFKIRRDQLYNVLKSAGMFPEANLFAMASIELYELRAKAVTERIGLNELGRVFILINQRRGFLSNRKSVSEEENSTEYKERIASLENELGSGTIGQRLYYELKEGESLNNVLIRERTYLRQSYIEEFDRIWDQQKQHYPDLLTGGPQFDNNKGTLYDQIRNRIIFYQRPLKSQKGLVSDCLFEPYKKAVSKSSPYFELFRIYQKVNDLGWKTPEGLFQKPTNEQKSALVHELFAGKLNVKHKLTISRIKEVLGFKSRDKVYLNFEELDGSATRAKLSHALIEAGIQEPEKFLYFNPEVHDEKKGLLDLWHITYSLPSEKEVIDTLSGRFGFTRDQSKVIANKVGFGSDFGSLSTRAIKKLLPHMKEGLSYSEACDKVGYDHSGYKTEIKVQQRLDPIKQNSLRNPVVEQILNQVVNCVNLILDRYGKIDEIRVELARELRNSAKTRKKLSLSNSQNKKENDLIRKRLRDDYGYKIVNGRDVQRFKLWEETGKQCLYCSNPISINEILSGQADTEHILPRSRSFSNAMSNFILAHRKCNQDKGQRTAYDFMESKGDDRLLHQFIEKVNALYADGTGKISKAKFENLLCRGEDIPSDFVDRMLKDSQYISRESIKLLKKICPNTYSTTGQITDLLRDEWELKELLKEVNIHKYRAIGLTAEKEIKTSNGFSKKIEIIEDWSKRDDHRHHAIDALICALTDAKIIFKLNNLNKIYQLERDALSKDELAELEAQLEGKFTLKELADQKAYEFHCPIKNVRQEARAHLDEIFISFKKSNSKVLTKNINRPKGSEEQDTWVPRARLHEETVMGKAKRIADAPVKLNNRFMHLDQMVNQRLKDLVANHLEKYNNNAKEAFKAATLKKDPIVFRGKEITEVMVFEEIYTKRIPLDENITPAKVDKIIDPKIKALVLQRMEQVGNLKNAMRSLQENPIWLNQERGIKVTRVTVSDESKVIPIGQMRDHLGRSILQNGLPQPAGYVITGGNHHALIFKDDQGNFNDKVVSVWDAVGIGLLNFEQTGKPYPIIQRSNDDEKGAFQFSMQINDLFVFDLRHSKNPQEEGELDFYDPSNRKVVSAKLFRVQKLSKNKAGTFQVDFLHHLETSISRITPELRGITWERFQSNSHLNRITKIRINHLGNIVRLGE
ncbi:MAG: type II CRISPR RNA-guided endonuclease Cas9 [Bacteroidia bacterium]|nr:type II CRISPR RNA-guided endonuclease Cas9 [Bacteroidia bacterium]